LKFESSLYLILLKSYEIELNSHCNLHHTDTKQYISELLSCTCTALCIFFLLPQRSSSLDDLLASRMESTMVSSHWGQSIPILLEWEDQEKLGVPFPSNAHLVIQPFECAVQGVLW